MKKKLSIELTQRVNSTANFLSDRRLSCASSVRVSSRVVAVSEEKSATAYNPWKSSRNQ